MKLDLACNYSKELMTLLSSGSVNLDWIKLSRWDVLYEEVAVARPVRPILLHVLPSAGDDPPTHPPANELLAAIEICNSPHIALHLSTKLSRWSPTTSSQEVMGHIVPTILSWKEILPIPLLLENVTYYGKGGFMRCVSDPEFITEVCYRTSTELLLDLAHARIAAEHRDEELLNYLESLPLALVKEVHINGPGIEPGFGLRDMHQEIHEEDYLLLSWLLSKTNPDILTLEYGGTGPYYEGRSSIEILRRQLERLEAVIVEFDN